MSSKRSLNSKHLLIKKLELPKENLEAYFPNINKLQLKPSISIHDHQRKGKIISLSAISTREQSFKKSLSPIISRASSIFTKEDSFKSPICPEIEHDITRSSRILKKSKKFRKQNSRRPANLDGNQIKRKKSSFLIIRGNDVKSVERLINITKFYSEFHEKSKKLLSKLSRSIYHEGDI
jgi:hypothetical protein